MSIRNNQITFSTGKNANDPENPAKTTAPVSQKTTVEQFVEAVTEFLEIENKRDCQWFCPSTFSGTRRVKAEVEKTGSFMAFDFDGLDNTGIDNRLIAGWLKELRSRDLTYAAVTSYNHYRKASPGKSRCRIVLFADKQIPEEKWLEVWKYWAAFFSDPETGFSLVDRAPQHTAAIFYTGHPTNEKRRWSRKFFGRGFDPDSCQSGVTLVSLFKKKENKCHTIRRFAPKSDKSLAWRGDKLDRSEPITLSDGSIIYCDQVNPGDKFPCFSPWRTEENPSAFIAATDKGAVFVHDTGDGTTRFFLTEGEIDSDEVCHLFSLIKKRKTSVTPHQYVSDIMGELEASPSTYYLLRAPLGAGKTSWVKEQSKKFGSVICQIDSVALAKACSKDFDLEEYTDLKHTPDKLCTTTHSAHKFEVPFDDHVRVGWDLAIQDEITGIMNAWVSPILKGMGQIAKECTLNHATSGGTSVFMSADFTDDLQDLVEELIKARDPRAKIIKNQIPVKEGQRHISLYKSREWKKELLLACSKHKRGESPIVAMVTSTSSPKALSKEIEKINKKARILWISSENSDTPEIRNLLSDPNAIIKDYDIILLSPTVKAGFSFDLPVKRVFAKFTGGVVARDFCQMLLRCRNVEDPRIVTYIAESKGEWNIDPKFLEALALRKAGMTEEGVDSSMIHFSIQKGERVPHDPELLKIWVHFERERRLTLNNRKKAFLDKARFHGWTFSEHEDEVTEEEANVLAESARKAREACEEERQGELLSAQKIDSERAEQIDNAHTKSKEEKVSLERYKIEDFYGEEISIDLIEKDKKGKIRKIVRDWEVFRRWQTGDKSAAAIKDWHNIQRKQATEYRHTMIRMAQFDMLIRKGLGCTLEEFEGRKICASGLIDRLQEYLNNRNNRQAIQEIIGMSCTEASAQNPSRWFLELTKRVGATWIVSRKRVNGEVVREYELDLSPIKELSHAEANRIDDMISDFQDTPELDVTQTLQFIGQ